MCILKYFKHISFLVFCIIYLSFLFTYFGLTLFLTLEPMSSNFFSRVIFKFFGLVEDYDGAQTSRHRLSQDSTVIPLPYLDGLIYVITQQQHIIIQ